MAIESDKHLGDQLAFVVAQQPYDLPTGEYCVSLAPLLNLDTGEVLAARPAEFPNDGLVFWYNLPSAGLSPGDIVVGPLRKSELHYEDRGDWTKSWYQVKADEGRRCGDELFEYFRTSGLNTDDVRHAIRCQKQLSLEKRPTLPFYLAVEDHFVGPFARNVGESHMCAFLSPHRSGSSIEFCRGEQLVDFANSNGGLCRATVSHNNHKPGDDNAEQISLELRLIRNSDLTERRVTSTTQIFLSDEQAIARACGMIEGRQKSREIRDSLQGLITLAKTDAAAKQNGIFDGLDSVMARLNEDSQSVNTIASSMLKHDKVKASVKKAANEMVHREVKNRAAEIEADAQKKTASVQQMIADAKDRRRDLESQVLEREEKLSSLAEQEANHQQRMDSIVAATVHRLTESRSELFADAVLIKNLLGVSTQESPRRDPSQQSGQAENPESECTDEGEARTSDGESDERKVESASVALLNRPALTVDQFLTQRLHGTLVDHGCGAANLRELHAAVTAAPFVVFDHAGWGKAYCDAMGGSAVLTVVSVEPTWMKFADVWAAIGPAWKRAISAPDQLHMIGLEGVNRSPSFAWLRPLVHLAVGWNERLPRLAGCGWPNHLRLFLTQEVSGETFDNPEGIEAWAVRISSGDAIVPRPIDSGHVLFDEWRLFEDSIQEVDLSEVKEVVDSSRLAASRYRPLIIKTARRMWATYRVLGLDDESVVRALKQQFVAPEPNTNADASAEAVQ